MAASLTDIIRAGAGGPEVKSGIAAIDAGSMFAPGRLDQLRAAAGLQPQGDIRQATAEALTSAAEETYVDPSETPLVQDLSALLQGIKNRQAQTTANLQAIDLRDSDDLGSAPTSQKTITQQLSDLSKELGAAGPDGDPGIIDEVSGDTATTEGASSETTTPDGTTTTTTTETTATTQEGELGAMGPDGAPGDMQAATLSPMEKLLSDTMEDFNKAAGKDTTGKTIDDYKQDFADATGVKIDGKPDKSHALMAFGLALMQNKAGKGFNVGEMLSAVGAAGEKAMPAFQKAKEQARAEKVAAGKYALGKVAEDKAAEAATAKSQLEYIRELQKGVADAQEKERLELIKGVEARKLKRLETELKIFEEGMLPEDEREYEKSYNLTFAAGQGPASSWEIKMAYDKKKPDQAVLVNAEPMIRKYIDGRAGIDDAIDLIYTMKDAATEIAEGGGTAKFAYDRINAVAKSLFPDLNTGNPTSEEQYTQALNMIMGRFKRFLTQETGNGISNRDVDIWERDIMKKPSWFQNLDATMNALDLLEDTFVQKREEFDAGIDHLYNPAYHRDQDAYNALVDKYGTADQIKGTQGRLIFKDGKLVRG